MKRISMQNQNQHRKAPKEINSEPFE